MPVTVAPQTKEARMLSKVEDFPREANWSRRIYTYEGAVKVLNETKNGGKERPLAADVYCDYYGGGRVFVDSGVGGGDRARVVQVDEAGNLSLSKKTVGSTDPKEVESALDKGHRLADATTLTNTQFIEQVRGELIVFGSKNAAALSTEDFREGWYVAGSEQKSAPKPTVADPEVLLREEKQALEADKLTRSEVDARIKERESRVAQLEKLVERQKTVETKKTAVAKEEAEISADTAKLVRKE